MSGTKVLSVVSEVYPLIKTGGLADVAGALPGALLRESVEVVTLVPGYPAVLDALDDASVVLQTDDLHGGPARILRGMAKGLDILAIDAPHLYRRVGGPYAGPDGADWPDNPFRFAALAGVGAWIGFDGASGWRPDVIHAHDWQAGLTAAYLHYDGRPRPASVMTVHNLAFQGQYPPELLGRLGLPPRSFAMDGVEYYGTIGFLKAGLRLSDRITTVSPSYAAEIRTAEGGMGLDGLLRERACVLHGILNGIDTEVWNPATDRLLPTPYESTHIGARAANKASLQSELGLDPNPHALVIGVISRLSWQKGLDLLLAALPAIEAVGGQLALLGAGERALEEGFRSAAAVAPGRIGVRIGYDEGLAHRMQAGSDALLVPSRFEPCGLTQLCALRYGAVPVVARVGGLADTVVDANEMARAVGAGTGIQFAPVTLDMLTAALYRTAELWRDRPGWARLIENGMATDVSWTRPAAHYARLYRDLLAARAAGVL
jgi:starch synthase